MIPTSSPPVAQPDAALEPAGAVLAESGVAPVALERAREAAGIVLDLTGDAPLAVAAMLHTARQWHVDAPELTASQGTRLGLAATRLAGQLDRLGDFQLDGQ